MKCLLWIVPQSTERVFLSRSKIEHPIKDYKKGESYVACPTTLRV